MYQIVIRKAEADDAPAMLAYMKQVGTETDNLTFGKEGLDVSMEKERQWITRSNSATGCSFTAFDGPRVVGNIQLIAGSRERTRHVAEMSVAVLEECWGHGVSSALFRQAMVWADQHKVTKVNLLVRADNERAKAFYRKCGFVKEGVTTRMFRIDDTYIDGEYWGLLR